LTTLDSLSVSLPCSSNGTNIKEVRNTTPVGGKGPSSFLKKMVQSIFWIDDTKLKGQIYFW
jgi:hypothetical protein